MSRHRSYIRKYSASILLLLIIDFTSAERTPKLPSAESRTGDNYEGSGHSDGESQVTSVSKRQTQEISHVVAVPQRSSRRRLDKWKSRSKRSKVLDIVIAHYDPQNIPEMMQLWVKFLNGRKVQEWKPYVYIYCQNEHANLTEEDFYPILQHGGGELLHLGNIGRESHAYLQHILTHYDDLADHTAFAQDISNPDMSARFENLVEKRTGFMPLSWWGHQKCEDDWLPTGWVPQMYAMFTREICPPVGYSSSFQGQFIVSRKRIRDQPRDIYRRMQDYLEADREHFLHTLHDKEWYKDKSNPFFGHLLERTWSLAFNCFESWRATNCGVCEKKKGMQGCGEGDCQCFDRE